MENKKNIPVLRFPEFKEEWENKKFGDLFDFYSTNSFSRSLLNYEGGTVKNIHYGDIHTKFQSNFYIQNEEVPFINQEVDLGKIHEDNYCKVGDLVIADASEDYKDIGKTIEIINLDNQRLLAGLHTYIARDNKNVTTLGFKGYLMQTFFVRQQMMKAATGISVLGITKGNLGKLILYLPKKEEQMKIAKFLTAIDIKIQKLIRKKVLLEKYKKGMLQQFFSQEIRFKDDEGKDFPDWDEKKLCEIASFVNLKNKLNTVTFVLTNSATKGIVSQLDYFDKDIANQDNLGNYYIVEMDDFVYNPRISAYAPVGPIKRNCLGKGVMSPLYSVFRFKEKYLDFFEYYFHTNLWHHYMESIANYGARHDRMNITNKDFMNMPIPLPSLNEQQKIVNFLTAIDNKIKALTKQIDLTKTFKRGLLQQMFI